MKTIVMVVEVGDQVDFEKEMGWVEESGIHLKSYSELDKQAEQLNVMPSGASQLFYYDVYVDDGNIAYLETNISNEEMEKLENWYMKHEPKQKGESRSAFIDRFLDYLRKNKRYRFELHLRPEYSLFIGL